MSYFLVPIILLVFFELLGNASLNFLKMKSVRYNAPIGFIVTMAVFYVVSMPFCYFHLSFSLYYKVSLLILLCLIVFTVRFCRFKECRLDKTIVVVILFAVLQLAVSWNTTLGHQGYYDSSFYINYVADIMTLPSLNIYNSVHGGYALVPATYALQSYYHFAAVIICFFQTVFAKVGRMYDLMPAFIWGFSTLYYVLFAVSSFVFMDELHMDKQWKKIVYWLFVGLFVGGMYWNDVFAFYGNTFRTLLTGFCILYIWKYFKEENKSNYALLTMSAYALSSVSSTGVYIVVLMVYAFFLIDTEKNPNAVKNIVILSILPLINLIIMFQLPQEKVLLVGVIAAVALLYAMNDWLMKLNEKIHLNRILFVAVPIVLAALSLLRVSGGSSYSIFIDNWSGEADMTWDYLSFEDWRHVFSNAISLGLMIFYFVKQRKEKLTLFFFALLITFFNPLVTPIIHKFMVVFYRAYDLLLNPFTYLLFLQCLEIASKAVYKMVAAALVFLSTVLGVHNTANYYDDSFKPTEDFNHFYKMDQDELDMVLAVANDIPAEREPFVQVIGHSVYLRAFNTKIQTLWGRANNLGNGINRKELFSIFYPVDYYGDPNQPENPEYEKAFRYIYDGHYEYVIENKRINLYNEEDDYYYPRWWILRDTTEVFYENDSYIVFKYYY